MKTVPEDLADAGRYLLLLAWSVPVLLWRTWRDGRRRG